MKCWCNQVDLPVPRGPNRKNSVLEPVAKQAHLPHRDVGPNCVGLKKSQQFVRLGEALLYPTVSRKSQGRLLRLALWILKKTIFRRHFCLLFGITQISARLEF